MTKTMNTKMKIMNTKIKRITSIQNMNDKLSNYRVGNQRVSNYMLSSLYTGTRFYLQNLNKRLDFNKPLKTIPDDLFGFFKCRIDSSQSKYDYLSLLPKVRMEHQNIHQVCEKVSTSVKSYVLPKILVTIK